MSCKKCSPTYIDVQWCGAYEDITKMRIQQTGFYATIILPSISFKVVEEKSISCKAGTLPESMYPSTPTYGFVHVFYKELNSIFVARLTILPDGSLEIHKDYDSPFILGNADMDGFSVSWVSNRCGFIN